VQLTREVLTGSGVKRKLQVAFEGHGNGFDGSLEINVVGDLVDVYGSAPMIFFDPALGKWRDNRCCRRSKWWFRCSRRFPLRLA
jgi:hypothetical protein